MICMTYDHNKKFGLFKFHSGYSRKIVNAQTVSCLHEVKKVKTIKHSYFTFPRVPVNLLSTDRSFNTEAGLSDPPPPSEIK